MNNKALIMVDLQNDFCPGGTLPVSGGEELMPIANFLQPSFDCVIATQDWHPPGHLGFASMHSAKHPGDVIELNGLHQILWPDHCVQGTHGAAFHPLLNTQRITHIIQKGTDPAVDSYSAFFDNARRHTTGLKEWLQTEGITDLWIMGIATDYCVKFTCLDALQCGFRVYLLADACRGVELHSGDCEAACQAMVQAGVIVSSSQSIRSVG